jgi:hypothetical protein
MAESGGAITVMDTVSSFVRIARAIKLSNAAIVMDSGY